MSGSQPSSSDTREDQVCFSQMHRFVVVLTLSHGIGYLLLSGKFSKESVFAQSVQRKTNVLADDIGIKGMPKILNLLFPFPRQS